MYIHIMWMSYIEGPSGQWLHKVSWIRIVHYNEEFKRIKGERDNEKGDKRETEKVVDMKRRIGKEKMEREKDKGRESEQ